MKGTRYEECNKNFLVVWKSYLFSLPYAAVICICYSAKCGIDGYQNGGLSYGYFDPVDFLPYLISNFFITFPIVGCSILYIVIYRIIANKIDNDSNVVENEDNDNVEFLE